MVKMSIFLHSYTRIMHKSSINVVKVLLVLQDMKNVINIEFKINKCRPVLSTGPSLGYHFWDPFKKKSQ